MNHNLYMKSIFTATVSCTLVVLLLLLSFPFVAFVGWKLSPPNYKVTEKLHFDFSSSTPTAEVWLQGKIVEGIDSSNLKDSKVRNSGRRVFPKGSKYLVMFDFSLPESDHNLAIGMFQVTAEALSENNHVIHRSRVPCLIRWKSWVWRRFKLFLYAMPYSLGLFEEKQDVKLVVLESKEGKIPLAGVRIILNAVAGMSPSKGLPQLYKAKVVIQKADTGWIPWFGAIKRLVSIVAIVTMLLCFEALFIFLCIGKYLLRKSVQPQVYNLTELENTTDNNTSNRVFSFTSLEYSSGEIQREVLRGANEVQSEADRLLEEVREMRVKESEIAEVGSSQSIATATEIMASEGDDEEWEPLEPNDR